MNNIITYANVRKTLKTFRRPYDCTYNFHLNVVRTTLLLFFLARLAVFIPYAMIEPVDFALKLIIIQNHSERRAKRLYHILDALFHCSLSVFRVDQLYVFEFVCVNRNVVHGIQVEFVNSDLVYIINFEILSTREWRLIWVQNRQTVQTQSQARSQTAQCRTLWLNYHNVMFCRKQSDNSNDTMRLKVHFYVVNVVDHKLRVSRVQWWRSDKYVISAVKRPWYNVFENCINISLVLHERVTMLI